MLPRFNTYTPMGRSSLDPHSDFILRLHAAGGRPQEIASELRSRRGFDCDATTVSRWISSNCPAPPENRDTARKRGRPGRRESQVSFDFLGGLPNGVLKSQDLPTFLGLFSVFTRSIDNGSIGAKALYEIGINVEPTAPKSSWILPAARLRSLSDPELCLLAYLLTDVREPPVEQQYPVFAAWLLEIIAVAKRLKASIAQGGFVWVEDLMSDERASQ